MNYIIRHTGVGGGPAGPIYKMGDVVDETALRALCDFDHLLKNQAIQPYIPDAPTPESPHAAPRYGYTEDAKVGPGVLGHVEISTEILTMERQAQALAAGPGKIISFGPAGFVLPGGLMLATPPTPAEAAAFNAVAQKEAEVKAAGTVSASYIPAASIPETDAAAKPTKHAT